MPKFATLAEKIEAYSIPEPNSGCLLWTRAVCTKGYGHSSWQGEEIYTHRATWEMHNGPIPVGMHVCHNCDVPACNNIAHLRIDTHKGNMADKRLRNRQPRLLDAWNGKLSADDVRAIRADKRLGRVIAAEYGIVRSLVYDIRNRKRRAHVPDLPARPLFVGVQTPERSPLPVFELRGAA